MPNFATLLFSIALFLCCSSAIQFKELKSRSHRQGRILWLSCNWRPRSPMKRQICGCQYMALAGAESGLRKKQLADRRTFSPLRAETTGAPKKLGQYR
ncbi:hypothetical protein AALO_G00267100 [Alosa alosa]|uniref:Secreted protein n=1 Tax=Alosa alosa TaxID=278164 RepID=A0AAV6FQ71_9TELE|nr:hypothetical protein AALO_G00267100 [Alosa alosa]